MLAQPSTLSDAVINFLSQHTEIILHLTPRGFTHRRARGEENNCFNTAPWKVLLGHKNRVVIFQACLSGRSYSRGFHWDKGIREFYTSHSGFFRNETSNTPIILLLPEHDRHTLKSTKQTKTSPSLPLSHSTPPSTLLSRSFPKAGKGQGIW